MNAHHAATAMLLTGLSSACTIMQRVPEPAPVETVAAPEPTPASAPVEWTMVGQAQVQGREDGDVIPVSSANNRFSFLGLNIESSKMRLRELKIEFTDGSTYTPPLPQDYDAGDAVKIALPNGPRSVAAVHLRYSDRRGGGSAHVEIWGR